MTSKEAEKRIAIILDEYHMKKYEYGVKKENKIAEFFAWFFAFFNI